MVWSVCGAVVGLLLMVSFLWVGSAELGPEASYAVTRSWYRFLGLINYVAAIFGFFSCQSSTLPYLPHRGLQRVLLAFLQGV